MEWSLTSLVPIDEIMQTQGLITLLITVMTVTFHSQAQDRSQARSMVISQYGIAATEHPSASQAAATVLAQGGTAVDAAIAANAAMGVLSPMMCGIGGDLFAIVYEAKSGKLHGLNASGWSPKGLTPDFLEKKQFTNMPITGIHSVTVPGAVDGWHKLHERFGKLSFNKILAPAVQLAESGFPVSELVSEYWAGNEKLLGNDANAASTFLVNGRTPKAGELIKNPDLAWSYRQIMKQGRKTFYEGKIAERILTFSKRMGGTLSRDDLKDFSSEWVEPISTTYRDWTVYELPPNGQGIAALSMLNIMEQFPIHDYGFGSTRALHVMIEAKKLAYADMIKYVADPSFSNVPVREMLDKSYAAQRARLIDPNKANCQADSGDFLGRGSDTTYLSVVDKEGNIVSLIQSIYYIFGSGLVADGTGFILQNRGGLFSFDPKHPNLLAGRKRPLHTIIPGFMTKGDVRIAFGIMGGWNQSQAHAQFVSNIADHEMNLQAALEAPRFTKATFAGCDVQMESRLPATSRSELEAKGHQIQLKGDFSQVVGGGQAVMRDQVSGINFGASDPRKDGSANPEPLPLRAR